MVAEDISGQFHEEFIKMTNICVCVCVSVQDSCHLASGQQLSVAVAPGDLRWEFSPAAGGPVGAGRLQLLGQSGAAAAHRQAASGP